MEKILDFTDKRGRNFTLSQKAWTHIRTKHSLVENPEEIKETILNSDNEIKIESKNRTYFYKYFKNKKQTSKFLKIIVKYIKDNEQIVSAYFVRKIR